MTSNLQSRVDRERNAHTENDVLGNSHKVKALFSHTVTSKTMRRMYGDYFDRLSEVRGLSILDIGCGHGKLSLSLLGKGAAYVAGIDISEPYVSEAAAAAHTLGYSPDRFDFSVMDAHRLVFSEGQFDLVVGNGILHHLDLPVCLREIERVLKPGGFALFVEPLAGNPLLKLFRVLTPRARTVDESPLRAEDLDSFAQNWDVESRYYGILSAPVAAVTSIVLRPFPNNPLLAAADWVERRLSRFKALNPYNQYVLLVLIKRGKEAPEV
jgi:2-polyprenyl-3-methyl-5-hydroxy-6-metoxy-1,4-benzoquinol methylase